jgi:hypothetical protein
MFLNTCFDLYKVITSKVHKQAHKCSGLCQIHTFVQFKHEFVTKFFNQLGNLSHNSKQYLIFFYLLLVKQRDLVPPTQPPIT